MVAGNFVGFLSPSCGGNWARG